MPTNPFDVCVELPFVLSEAIVGQQEYNVILFTYAVLNKLFLQGVKDAICAWQRASNTLRDTWARGMLCGDPIWEEYRLGSNSIDMYNKTMWPYSNTLLRASYAARSKLVAMLDRAFGDGFCETYGRAACTTEQTTMRDYVCFDQGRCILCQIPLDTASSESSSRLCYTSSDLLRPRGAYMNDGILLVCAPCHFKSTITVSANDMHTKTCLSLLCAAHYSPRAPTVYASTNTLDRLVHAIEIKRGLYNVTFEKLLNMLSPLAQARATHRSNTQAGAVLPRTYCMTFECDGKHSLMRAITSRHYKTRPLSLRQLAPPAPERKAGCAQIANRSVIQQYEHLRATLEAHMRWSRLFPWCTIDDVYNVHSFATCLCGLDDYVNQCEALRDSACVSLDYCLVRLACLHKCIARASKQAVFLLFHNKHLLRSLMPDTSTLSSGSEWAHGIVRRLLWYMDDLDASSIVVTPVDTVVAWDTACYGCVQVEVRWRYNQILVNTASMPALPDAWHHLSLHCAKVHGRELRALCADVVRCGGALSNHEKLYTEVGLAPDDTMCACLVQSAISHALRHGEDMACRYAIYSLLGMQTLFTDLVEHMFDIQTRLAVGMRPTSLLDACSEPDEQAPRRRFYGYVP